MKSVEIPNDSPLGDLAVTGQAASHEVYCPCATLKEILIVVQCGTHSVITG